MCFVLHDSETCEPITVLSMGWLTDAWITEHSGLLRLPCYLSLDPDIPIWPIPEDLFHNIIDIHFESHVYNNVEFWCAFTKQSALALLMDASFLSGQQGTLHTLISRLVNTQHR